MTLSKKTKQIFIAIVLLGAIVGGWAVWYVFFKPHRDVSAEKPAYTLTADELNKAIADGNMATYIDKAIMVEGEVTEVDAKHLLMGSIVCNFEDPEPLDPSKAPVGTKVKVQGRVSTYNDLMGEVVMDKCTLK
jgi:hypothetical protein